MKLAFYIILSCLFIRAWSQDIQVYDRYDAVYGQKWAGHVAFRNVLLSDDYLLGLEGGVVSPSRKLTFFASFDARPFRKRILNHQGGNLFFQNTEERYFVGLGSEYLFYLPEKNHGLFVHLNGHYTWGIYGGTFVKPPNGWVLTPRIGAFWQFARFGILRGGYAYLDTRNPEVGKHRLYLSISGILTNENVTPDY